jgi:hypothetical protein
MHQRYDDILSRITEEPKWFDENGVPRYCVFRPENVAIYATECVLMEIECRSCGRLYRVATTDLVVRDWARRQREVGVLQGERQAEHIKLADLIASGEVAYGDPPNACCDSCQSGATMRSIPHRVLEYWHRYQRTGSMRWQRDASFEGEVASPLRARSQVETPRS